MATKTSQSTSDAPTLTDQELLNKAQLAENGRRFSWLFHDGWEHPGVRKYYETRRRAELGLLVRLLWWSGHDVEQTLRLFERSALHRPEWDEFDLYREDVLSAAKDCLGDDRYTGEPL